MGSGDDGLVFRLAVLDDEPQILALAARTLGWGSEPRWADLYRWKHDANAFGRSPRWVAVADGQVIGFRVFLRWEFLDGSGRIHRAVRAVDTATDPAHQGRGIFTRLTLTALDGLAEEGVDFVFNTPNDQSRPGYVKMGWQVLGRPPVMTLPTGPTGLLRQARARTAASLWSERSDAGRGAAEVLASPPAAELAAAWQPDGALATNRTIEFLRWRYGLDELHYRAVTVGGDPADGLAIFRVRRRGGALEATITEVLVPPGSGAAAARRTLVRQVARSSGADYVLVGHDPALRGVPAITLRSLGPILTWRSVTETVAPGLDRWPLAMGDLELF